MGYYDGKKILIIGGTGTIGKGLVKELLNQRPKVIRILSRDEYKQFIMEREIEDIHKGKLRFLIGDVRDYDRVERAMEDIDIVFNLAAMKHVPSCEYNPTEAIKTNVTGMENVIKAAIYHNVECVLFTSSDKAISPTNAYGATKLLAERLVQAANYSKGKARTKFVAVRFGNVMGSRGSVIPLFKKLILEKREITVTNHGMSRFMMTLTDAVKLTMVAAEKGIGGEVFVLKMPIIKLKDLAEIVVEETCKKYNIDINDVKIKTIGLRVGEKMYEELMTEEEAEFAYDLGDMYAVIPISVERGIYEKNYCEFDKAKRESYSSHGKEPIHKEEVRKLIISENLI
ncbi:SDR family NAD(P)-dependent oxidoreductase [Tepidibacter thalassicus]|uniref:Polysaccharide biosynthesis protein n=1 Tax=Tepidibacter thalassicus DSM 15285 TaxID=1123350 RepID=A0A1M5R3X5_9FIRM|nr:SDR family NAD(P)-dependent oxidoreductase [Tepidibacter thalassicus]SHH20720.1 Polysaccharide biosynthesis protein [Tepidibacter thalassicus DSM 15285]